MPCASAVCEFYPDRCRTAASAAHTLELDLGAFGDLVRSGESSVDLEDVERGLADLAQGLGPWLGVLDDAGDRHVAGDEDHVERDEGVAHPERPVLLLLHQEQHSLIGRQVLAEHEAALALCGGLDDLHLDRDIALRYL